MQSAMKPGGPSKTAKKRVVLKIRRLFEKSSKIPVDTQALGKIPQSRFQYRVSGRFGARPGSQHVKKPSPISPCLP